ncbi:MAG: DUF262 domain-containing protein [Gammaproteobacteria bacterium]|nr:DUF262 domain-containing protein [Gammaproteobacteria bacterium]
MTQDNAKIEEQIEGLEDSRAGSWGDYPIDTLLIRNEQRTVHDVLRRIQDERFIMNPEFQRDFIWGEDKQSRLIESVVMRIPLPVFYLAEDDRGRMIVVDGLQRLSTFERFVNNKLQLRLPDRGELNGKKFKDLPPKLQNRIEDCNLILYIIDHKVPEQARLDIFERVNGGVPLTRQQMRNCLFMGEATRFLRDESKTTEFKKATGNSLRSETMRDREFVNRFCAFQMLDVSEYRDMDGFLANALKKINHEPELAHDLSRQFRVTLDNNFFLFGKHAFRKHQPGQARRNLLNASLWDVMSTGFSKIPAEIVKARSSDAKELFYQLLSHEGFTDSITRSPNSPNQVRCRFALAREAFSEVFNAYSD